MNEKMIGFDFSCLCVLVCMDWDLRQEEEGEKWEKALE